MKLLVIDIQKGIVDDELYNVNSFKRNVSKLIKCARENHIEVIYVKHDDGKGSGFSIGDIAFELASFLKPLENEKIYIKTVNSAFHNKELKEYLESTNDKDLMIIGLQTEYCIDATIKQAFDLGYKVIVPIKANSTFDNNLITAKVLCKFYNEEIWDNRFAKCASIKEAIEILSK